MKKGTKYFLNKCKQNYNSKCIQSLITEHGLITKENEILKEENTFYETLYTKEASNINDTSDSSLLQNLTIPKVSDTLNEQTEQDITIDEIAFASKQLPNNKSPDSDGLPTEFYKLFWKNIKSFVFNSFMYAFDTNELSIDKNVELLL